MNYWSTGPVRNPNFSLAVGTAPPFVPEGGSLQSFTKINCGRVAEPALGPRHVSNRVTNLAEPWRLVIRLEILPSDAPQLVHKLVDADPLAAGDVENITGGPVCVRREQVRLDHVLDEREIA
jgi:hypothetical protein